jgi:hypothetical protein
VCRDTVLWAGVSGELPLTTPMGRCRLYATANRVLVHSGLPVGGLGRRESLVVVLGDGDRLRLPRDVRRVALAGVGTLLLPRRLRGKELLRVAVEKFIIGLEAE